MENIGLNKYVKNNCQYTEDITPKGMVEIDVYDPSPSTTPWDYYGMKHQREYRRVLHNAGIEHVVCLETRRLNLSPSGTGPGGSIRLGDSMMPHTYRIAVYEDDVNDAIQAIQEHKQAIDEWMGGGPMPDACR